MRYIEICVLHPGASDAVRLHVTTLTSMSLGGSAEVAAEAVAKALYGSGARPRLS